MNCNRYDIADILRLLFTILGAGLTGYGCAIGNKWHIIIGIIITACCFAIYIKHKARFKHKLHILWQAISNRDYNFRSTGTDTIDDFINSVIKQIGQERLEVAFQEKYYELIINSMSIGVMVSDEDGNIEKFNNETLRLFNRNIITHISQLSIWDNIDQTLSTLNAGEKRHILIHHNQKELNISVHLDVFTARGKMYRIYTFNDIHSEIDRNEFDSWLKLTRVLTHEIMNGIAPINSLCDTMMQDSNLPARVHDGLKAISTSSQSLINFVDAYRRFMRIPTPSPSLVYVNTLLKQAQELYHDVKISTCITPHDLIVYADEVLITQVISNIIKNAVEAMENTPDGEIRIKAYCNESEQVKIEIANNGPKIPKDVADEIFVPFFTTKSTGNGIGLSVSRQIMHLSGGNLSLSTIPSSKFATVFTLTFP